MRHSRVRSDIAWIEQQFLSGLSVHDFEPAPFEMDERQTCTTRKPLREAESIGDVLNRPDSYLPPIDEHPQGVMRAQTDLCASWLTTTPALHMQPRCPGCNRLGMSIGSGAFGQQWICESQRYESGPAPIDDKPTDYRQSSRAIDCDGELHPADAFCEPVHERKLADDSGDVGGPALFWVIVCSAGAGCLIWCRIIYRLAALAAQITSRNV